MSKLEEIREFIEQNTNSLREEIQFFGRNPQTQEEKQIVAIYSAKLALLEELSLLVDSEE